MKDAGEHQGANDADERGAASVELVREHYDRLSPFYNALWGEHIHHGFFEADEPPALAQRKLTERLAARAKIERGSRVLDVGCGLGGSSLWLARELGCEVVGVTISPVQARAASTRARRAGLAGRVRFEVADANRLKPPRASFDAVWVVECSEHLTDKARFIEAAARALRPGGRLALCAWLAGDEASRADDQARLVGQVCEAMLCPSLATRAEYVGWMSGSGFEAIVAEDITRRVEPTWEHCAALARRADFRAALALLGERTRRFVSAFDLMLRAYRSGAMAYGMFTATRRDQRPVAVEP